MGKLSDYPQIKFLAESVWSQDYLIDGFFDIINDPKSHFLVVEDNNNEILGCINALIYNFDTKSIGYLETLRVRADVHNQGIGTLLTKKALQHLESKRISQVGYVTGFQNQKSIQIALNNGFTQIGRWPAALIDFTQLQHFLSNDGKVSKSSEPSTTEILQFLKKNRIDWYNCHWEFFPPSESLIAHLKEEAAMFIQSVDKSLLSYISQYETRLVGNVVGKPNSDSFLDIISQITDKYDLAKFEEFRIFLQERYQSFYSIMPFMDFSKKKGLIFFIKDY